MTSGPRSSCSPPSWCITCPSIGPWPPGVLGIGGDWEIHVLFGLGLESLFVAKQLWFWMGFCYESRVFMIFIGWTIHLDHLGIWFSWKLRSWNMMCRSWVAKAPKRLRNRGRIVVALQLANFCVMLVLLLGAFERDGAPWGPFSHPKFSGTEEPTDFGLWGLEKAAHSAHVLLLENYYSFDSPCNFEDHRGSSRSNIEPRFDDV